MDRRIEAAIQLIHNDTCHRFDIAQLAQAVNLSTSRFSHLFKTEISQSPKQYVHEYKLQQAKLLLEDTFLKVSQIAIQLGYRHTSSLTRDFTKFYGYPPSRFRTRGDQWHARPKLQNGFANAP
jgi:AraC family transcriptional regulator of arabinose operon